MWNDQQHYKDMLDGYQYLIKEKWNNRNIYSSSTKLRWFGFMDGINCHSKYQKINNWKKRSLGHIDFLMDFSLLICWPLFSRLGRLMWQKIKWKYYSHGYLFFFFNDGDNFSLVLKLCGNTNLLGVNARLERKPKSFNNLAKFHYIGDPW
jgi:hypothetical protein